jgi:CheY-like chemotaxis protein
VSVKVEARDQSTVRLLFSVRDSGICIAKEHHQTIFQAFSQADGSSTRKYGGTGLGLTISAQLVELMNGRIWVESEPGVGSTFFFTAEFCISEHTCVDALGAAPPPSLASKKSAGAEPSPGLRVLVVEDNAVNRKVASRLLERQGHEVTLAINGKDALDVIEKYDWNFDLVLMDVQMPEMDGLEATEIIRSREADHGVHLPIIALTAHAMERDRERCLLAGVDAYLSKPIRTEELATAIAELGKKKEPLNVSMRTKT